MDTLTPNGCARSSSVRRKVAPDIHSDSSQLTLDTFAKHIRKRTAMGRKVRSKRAETWPEIFKAWPLCTVLIVANEFFQKFASLGTVLTLYLMNVLRLREDQTTIFFNLYHFIGGIVPLFGSILADGYIGKYNTIFYASIIYSLGKILMAGASLMEFNSTIHPWLDVVGIVIVTIGMGGIIPCVASFGGDQFEPHQERMLSIFFSAFYASINAGALISTFVLPLLRAQSCLDQDSCYPLSFGVSAGLMIVAAVLFVTGSRWYKKQPPEGNVFGDVWRVGKQALANRKAASTRLSHWLDHYFDSHSCLKDEKCMALQRRRKDNSICEKKRFIEDVKSLLRILIMYIPLPMFWALYDQQYSVWLIQSVQMDCRLWGDVLLLPDQMQIVNPVLILVFIALFESIIYPIVGKFVKLTPLRKMVAGGVLASLAFVVSAAVQLKVNATLPDLPKPPKAFVSVMNTFDNCNLNVTLLADGQQFGSAVYVPSNSSLVNNRRAGLTELFEVDATKNLTWVVDYHGKECHRKALETWDLPTKLTYTVEGGNIYYIYIGRMGAFIAKVDPQKPLGGTGEFSMAINLALTNETYLGNMALCRNNTEGTSGKHPCDPRRGQDFYFFQRVYDGGRSTDLVTAVNYTRSESSSSQAQGAVYRFKSIRPGVWRLYFLLNTPKSVGQRTFSKEQVNVSYTGVEFSIEGQGGVYVLLVTGDKGMYEKRVFQAVPDNSVSILWQIPQIAIITAAEILFSITGYEFAYSQSGKSMKSMMQALWFLTVAVGDLIIVLITLMNFSDMAFKFIIYAVAMLLVIIVFALLSIFYYEYRVVSPEEYDDNIDNEDDSEDNEDGGETQSSSDRSAVRIRETPMRDNFVLSPKLATKLYGEKEIEDNEWNRGSIKHRLSSQVH